MRTTCAVLSSSVLRGQARSNISGKEIVQGLGSIILNRLDKDLHNEVTRQAHQRQQDVFKRRRQRQGLAAQRAEVSCLDGTDVAL